MPAMTRAALQQRRGDQLVYGLEMRAAGGVQRSGGSLRPSIAAVVMTVAPPALVRILQARQIGRARPCAQITEQCVAARFAAQRVDARARITEVAEGDGARWAGRLAGGNDFAFADSAVFFLGVAPRAADALDAISAFLHHAAAPAP